MRLFSCHFLLRCCCCCCCYALCVHNFSLLLLTGEEASQGNIICTSESLFLLFLLPSFENRLSFQKQEAIYMMKKRRLSSPLFTGCLFIWKSGRGRSISFFFYLASGGGGRPEYIHFCVFFFFRKLSLKVPCPFSTPPRALQNALLQTFVVSTNEGRGGKGSSSELE